MAIHFQRGTAHIDWCEPNYEFSPNIAEFFNTISNCIYFVIPPLNIYLFSEYSSKVGQSFNVVWLLMMVIGASSAYFHATLSLVGQLLDEVAILWVLLAGYTLWTPEWMIKNMGLFKTSYHLGIHLSCCKCHSPNDPWSSLCTYLVETNSEM
ncbi:alkaline ceramidase-like isoform X2 [Xenia sp. Carnegie-2017]|uniref:alkaline ceramidase-like isoform X2 n=1 Tax=Xenia sp. Carnegie-2017 TaxID=2897299 RepID=UPI001F037227|nr:alkaline ceramidase-like isoform X2 [Xenia sp. Carnegie-2017]